MKNKNELLKEKNDGVITGLNIFKYFALGTIVLFWIRIVSLLYKKSLLQIGIEGFNTDIMTMFWMIFLSVVLLYLIKLGESYKKLRKAELYNQQEYLREQFLLYKRIEERHPKIYL